MDTAISCCGARAFKGLRDNRRRRGIGRERHAFSLNTMIGATKETADYFLPRAPDVKSSSFLRKA
jgi:hypothetical protein